MSGVRCPFSRQNIPIRKDDDPCTVFRGLNGVVRQSIKRRLQPPFPRSAFPVPHPQRHRRECRHVFETVQFVVGEDRARHLNEVCVLRRLGEDVRLVADIRHDRYHELLANRIDRRVRHLRKKLMEEIEERTTLPGEAGQRGVIAHGTDRFMSGLGHRPDNQLDVFERPSETRAFALKTVPRSLFLVPQFRRHNLCEESSDGNVVLLHPAAIGLPTRVVGLEFRILHQSMLGKIKPEKRAGAKAPVAFDLFRSDVEHARFGSEDEKTRLRERPSCGTESVPVKRRAKPRAIGEADGGRSVPRLH